MKKSIVLCFALLGLTITSLSAQNDTIAPSKSQAKTSRGFIGAGVSLPLGLVLAGGARNGLGISISGNGQIQSAQNLPADYDGGNSLFGDNSDDVEKDYKSVLSVRLTKQFATNSKRIHWGLEAGPSFGRSVKADHFVPVQNPCSTDPFFGITFCNRNYTYQIVKSNSTGLSLKTKMGIEISEDLMVELGGFYNLNAEWTFFGVDIVGSFGVFKK